MTKPLEGIKVVEVAMWAFVPAAGGILSDLGAEVIKVEPPSGDPLRGLQIGAAGEKSRIDFSWESYNRGKRSIAVDFETPEGQSLVRNLASHADVVVENFKVGGLKKYGLDYESLKTVNPRLV